MGLRPHFISGLPRSGSTLLCAILRQNPRFTASMTSPVASLWGALIPRMSGKSEFSSFFDDDRRAAILRNTFNGYYKDVEPGQIVFDTNRSWTSKAALLQQLFPGSRIVCCVREVGWIIDSLERMLRKNPLQTSRVFNYNPGTSIYERVEVLMNSEKGLIGMPWSALREAWFTSDAGRLIIVDYRTLTTKPRETIQRLYSALGEPVFDHDFERVSYDEPDYDADLGMPGMHKVRERVEYIERPPAIPPDLFTKYDDASFWKNPRFRHPGLTIL